MKDCPKKQCIIAFLAVFAFIMIYEMLVHGSLLAGIYQETASVWRPKAQMDQMFPWMIAHNALLAAIFCCLFVRFADDGSACGATGKPPCPHRRGLHFGLKIGLLMGLLASKEYAWLPIPMNLALAWYFAAVAQGVGIGLILSALCRKKGECSAA